MNEENVEEIETRLAKYFYEDEFWKSHVYKEKIEELEAKVQELEVEVVSLKVKLSNVEQMDTTKKNREYDIQEQLAKVTTEETT